jgi:hypothetical protein
MKAGAPHFNVSSTSGHAECTVSRMRMRIGCAKGAAFAMYASTRLSRVPTWSPPAKLILAVELSAENLSEMMPEVPDVVRHEIVECRRL